MLSSVRKYDASRTKSLNVITQPNWLTVDCWGNSAIAIGSAMANTAVHTTAFRGRCNHIRLCKKRVLNKTKRPLMRKWLIMVIGQLFRANIYCILSAPQVSMFQFWPKRPKTVQQSQDYREKIKFLYDSGYPDYQQALAYSEIFASRTLNYTLWPITATTHSIDFEIPICNIQ